VICLDKSVQEQCLLAVSKMRTSGISSEVFFDYSKGLKDQLGHASNREIPLAVIIGTEESEKNTAKIKDLRSGDQKEIAIDDLVTEIKKLI